MSKQTTWRALLAATSLIAVGSASGAALAAPFTIAPVATTGQAVGPDGQTIVFFANEKGASSLDVNDLGQVAYAASTTPFGEVPPTGIFRGMAGEAPDVIAYQNDNLGPPDGVVVAVATQVSINNLGQTAFAASIATGGSFQSGLFVGDGTGTPTVTAFSGQPAGPGGDSFNGFLHPSLNDAGDTAFTGLLLSSDPGIFVDGGAEPSLGVALAGFPAGEPGSTLHAAIVPDLNDQGDIVFNGITDLQPGSIESGIFTVNAGGGPIENIAIEGVSAVTAADGSGGVISEVSTSIPALNNNDEVAFFAGAVYGGDEFESLLLYDDGLFEVLREGDAAGDTGETFTEFFTLATLNDNSDMAFLGSTTADAFGNDEGLFLTNRDGEVTTIAFEGDQLLDSLGVLQTIESFNGLLALSIAGVAFGVSYVGGGQGIFFAEFGDIPPSEVPLPAALPFMLAGLGALRFAARRNAASKTAEGRAS